jgi:hypothetical protein
VGTAADRTIDQLFDLAVVLGEVMNNRLAEHGLTPARAEVLWVLHRTGPRTQRELSHILKCTPRNVTGLVDALQAASSSAPRTPPTGGRSWSASAGKVSRSSPVGAPTARTGIAQVLGGIPADDLSVLSAVLDRVLAQLRATYKPT